MTDDFMKDRKKGLEDSFFAKRNAELLAELKLKDELKARRQALAEASGIQDEGILNRLSDLNITRDNIAAFALIPLLEVAWADGSLDKGERTAILEAASQDGIVEGTPAYELLRGWLSRVPGREVPAVWKAYIQELVKPMTEAQRMELKSKHLTRARRIAESAGGFLGFSKVSENEERVLQDLGSVF